MKIYSHSQCGMYTCRYNISGQCCSEVHYNDCTDVCRKVLGKYYEDFCEWEKEKLNKNYARNGKI